MQRLQPLPDTHPEFSLFQYQAYQEFRVENWRLAKDGSGRKIQGTRGIWASASLALLLVFILFRQPITPFFYVIVACLILLVFRIFDLPVLYESVILYPLHGIQLETHRGYHARSLVASRHFIPFTILEDVVINEGLKGWNVRYYLVASAQQKLTSTVLKVAYPNLLPHYAVLQKVYTGIQAFLPCNDGKITDVH